MISNKEAYLNHCRFMKLMGEIRFYEKYFKKGVKNLLLKNKCEERLNECKQEIEELNKDYDIMVKHVEEVEKYSHDLEKNLRRGNKIYANEKV